METNDGLNLAGLFGILRRRALWIVIPTVLAAGAAFAVSRHEVRKYTATASLVFTSNELAQQLVGLPATVSAQAQQNSNVRLVQIGNMANETATRLGRGLTPERVSESLAVAQQGETSIVGESSIVDVSATVSSPRLAAAIANTYAERFVTDQNRASRRYFDSALAVVDRQLAGLSPAQRLSAAGAALQSRAQALKLLADLQYGTVLLAQRAETPTSPSSPSTKKDTLIGAILGLFVGIALALLLERLDGRLREPKDLETLFHAPLLGTIPSAPKERRRGPVAKRAHIAAEGFELMFAHLQAFNAPLAPHAILITSSAPGDGKLTLSLSLAEAAARSGSRVLLVELDLRRPVLTQRLGLGPTKGVADVLLGTASAEDAVQRLDVEVSEEDTGRRTMLDLLPAGTNLTIRPSESLTRPALDALFRQLKAAYDFVFVDAPSPTAVSDAFAVLPLVDGVVIVASLDRERRKPAERLQQVLERSAAPVLGVVANRARVRLVAGVSNAYLAPRQAQASAVAGNATRVADEQSV